MTPGTRILRLLGGLLLIIAVVAATFAVMIPLSARWGATAAETTLPLPGDDILTAPQAGWTHAVTINSPPEQVWPWIAQMGDSRGGYYSFTFIEDRIGGLIGEPSYAVNYDNANTMVPAWQNPQPGDPMISGILKVAAVQPGAWLLADSVIPETMGWTWVWQVQTTADGRQTRLVNRTRIQTVGPDNPVANVMIGLGGFIMNQRSMHGLKAHAEGWSEPGYEEPLEIVLWFLTLAVGLVAAGLFVVRQRWQPPLTIALAAIILLMVLTFVQPAVWLRIVLDAILIAALVWAWRSTTLSPTKTEADEGAFG